MTVGAAPRWVIGERNRTNDRRLYCFAPGGGSVAEFVRWSRDLPGVDVYGVQLPGRGGRLREEPMTGMAALVESIVGQVRFEPPFAFFGHSMGALLCYEVAHALRAAGRPQPVRMWVSGYPAPHLPRDEPAVHRLPDAELAEEIARRHGGIPDEVLADPALLAVTVRALRADHQIIEEYAWTPRPVLDCPISVLGGRDDAIDESALRAWQEHTSTPVSVRQLPGGHYYFREQGRLLTRLLAQGLHEEI